jgi:hypothetical protein
VVAVAVVKRNRAAKNLDSVVANRGKLTYACVWRKADSLQKAWACFFALEIYDWKDLGSHTAGIPARSCVGIYMMPDKAPPPDAALDHGSLVAVPNLDVHDAFAR